MKNKVYNLFGIRMFLMSVLLFIPSTVQAATEISGIIYSNTIWTAENSPYVINGNLTVFATSILTIEQGAVVKFKYPSSKLDVYGTLQANGTSENKIYFTSYKDDTIGGDTNNDGNASSPLPKDWRQIIIYPNANANLNYSVIRYGGNGAFNCPNYICFGAINNKGNLNLTNSEITKNGTYGIYQTAGTSTVDTSIIDNHAQSGISVTAGDMTISHSTISNHILRGISVTGNANLILNDNTFANNTLDADIYASVNFTHANNISESGTGRGFFIRGDITRDAVWTPDTMPYVVNGFLSVPANNILTIKPGAIIKFEHNQSSLSVYGALNVEGEKENKVYFTSLKDDEVGGDTNGNASTTAPVAGDWRRILLNPGSIANIDNAIIKYGGYIQYNCPNYTCYGAINNKGNLNLINSEITKNGAYGIYQTAGTSTIHDSSILDNTSYGIFNSSPSIIDAINNWWGDDSGPYHPTLNPTGKGNRVSDKVLFDPWMKKITKNDPVILIPGILGTEMKRGDELLWMDIGKVLTSASDDFLDPLITGIYGEPVDNQVLFGDVLRKPAVKFDYFKGIIDEFILNNYQENVNLFVFPYDWRLDNKTNAEKLKVKIDEILTQTGSKKVDLVVHSMGGLIAKQYIVDNNEDKVAKLVFIGTPNLGAPKAFKALLKGDNFGIPLVLNQLEMKKLARNMTSVYQLLPSQTYFNRFGGYFINRNDLPDDYITTKNYLVENHLNDLLLQNAEQFHSNALDNFSAPNIDTYNITGCNTPTLGRIILRNYFLEGGIIKEDYDLKMVAGDGTVPFNSALAVSTKNHYYVINADHGKMPSQDGIRQLVAQIITGSVNNSELPNNIFTDTAKCFVRRGKLISVHSPVDLHVYDNFGNHVGLSDNGMIDENISDVIYENIADNKFIYLPEDENQTYTIKLDSTATSTFSFRVVTLNNDETEQLIYYNDIAITPESKGQLIINSTSTDTIMEFDYNGENNFIPLVADAVLDAEQAQDFIKPITQISLEGKTGLNGWFTSAVQVSLSANDDNSGILKTEYSLDNGSTWLKYIMPFEINTKGINIIMFKSTDKAGNKEEIKEEIIKIDTESPEVAFWFEPSIKDIMFEGKDNNSSVNILNNESSILLFDEAGNNTELLFKRKENHNLLSVELESIRYNETVFSQLPNSFKFEWNFDKENNLEHLNQNIKVEDNFKLYGEYNAKNNMTDIHGDDVNMCLAKEKMQGLILFKIQTNKGNLNYNF